nr:MAG TPA: hypothetical protein [Caudoviricetes sp.]
MNLNFSHKCRPIPTGNFLLSSHRFASRHLQEKNQELMGI